MKLKTVSDPTPTPGTVYLVGAGPGALDLVTLRAKQLLETCDVIVYDYLANARLLEWTREGCEALCVGKEPGRHSIPQADIEKILIAKAGEGKNVVRLKGGDPFIFGRGGEEAERLKAVGVRFEIVPAVTAALGGAAQCGIPLTHRELSSAVCFLTGHEDTSKGGLHMDFARYADLDATLAIYMGMGKLRTIVDQLLRGGMAPSTPVAVVQHATLPEQRSLCSTLAEVCEAVDAGGFTAPSVVYFGAVADRARTLNWSQQRALSGRRIVVTRSREQAPAFSAKLHHLGAEVLEIPLIEVVEYTDTAREESIFNGLHHYQWVIFTSRNGVRYFFKKARSHIEDIRLLGGMRIACIGEATAQEVRRHHIHVDYTPPMSTAETFGEALLKDEGLENLNVLVVVGNKNPPSLIDTLTKGRAIVDALQVYANRPASLEGVPALQRFREVGADALTFTSASTVDGFVDQAAALALQPGARRPKTASIGPSTSERMRARGLPVDVEARTHDLDGLAAAVASLFASDDNAQG